LFGTDLSEAVGILKDTSEGMFTIQVVKAPDQLQGLLFNRVYVPGVILKDGGAAAHLDLRALPVGSRAVVYASMVNEVLLPQPTSAAKHGTATLSSARFSSERR
jgi:hypothetical protein